MFKTQETRHLSVAIECPLARAYDFLWLPESFPKWASGLADSLRLVNGQWLGQTREGPVIVRFTERNPFGVLDHWVYPGSGAEIYVPLRLVANGKGCELILTLFRQPGMSDDQYQADVEWVLRDLETARTLLERWAA